MIDAVCRTCGKEQAVPALYPGLRCRYCSARDLCKASPKRKAQPAKRTPLEDLPPEGRKLREFMNAMGWSEREMARRIRIGLERRGEKDASCGAGMIHNLIHGHRMARYEMAATIAGLMRRHGHTPAVFYPGVETGRPRRPMRRDWWAARKRLAAKGKEK